MKFKGTIIVDDPKAERLGITREGFSDFFAWDCRPKYIGIVRLVERTQSDLETFLKTAQDIYSVVRICAPKQHVIETAQKYGYELKVDQAGTPYLTDEIYKLSKRK
jgi:hypothetical protein